MARYYTLPVLGPTPLPYPMDFLTTVDFLIDHPDFFAFSIIPLLLLGWLMIILAWAGAQDPQIQLAANTTLVIYLLIFGIHLIIKMLRALGGSAKSTSTYVAPVSNRSLGSSYTHPMSKAVERRGREKPRRYSHPTFIFRDRTTSPPKQGVFESNKNYRERVYREGKENLIRDTTGSKPRQGWFEGDESYRGRIAHEANERLIEGATGSEPRQGWFESDEGYRSRTHHEANERLVAGVTGSEPRQGWFESDEGYHSRTAHEANERIIETATGSAPRQGWLESEKDYSARMNKEAKEIKASSRDD